MRLMFSAALSAAIVVPASAAEMKVSVEIPRMTVAEYHRPYVAMWLEKAGDPKVVNLAVWYDIKLKQNEGAKWLKDMRQWWRKTGRELEMPVDGLSSPTRAPGTHEVTFDDAKLAGLAPGEYQFVIEAAREVGGRELLRIPVQWPPKPGAEGKAKGEHELGAVSVALKP